jgi:predicted site-specific integrase-resolvase
MSIVTINEAANLVGKSIKTIYRHIESGKLSCVIDDNGRKVVDMAELVRVYGLDLSLIENDNKVSMSDNGNGVENNIIHLEKEIELLKMLLVEKDKLLNEKDQRNADLKQALMLLEDKTKIEQPKQSWIGRLFGKNS